MRSWQRTLRPLLAIFVVAFAVVVYFAMRPHPQPPPPRHAPIDPRAQTEVSRGTVIRWKGKDVDFTLTYQAVVEYPGGQRKFRGVHITVKGEDGRDVQVTGAEASVSPDQTSFTVTGDVRLVSADGLTMSAQEASYSQAEAMMRAPGPVSFSRGAIHGTSVGMLYDERQDTVSLLASVSMTEDSAPGQAPATLNAGFAKWARREGRIDLERRARILRAGQALQADEASIRVGTTDQKLQRMELHGSASIEPEGEKRSPEDRLRSMRARDITLQYGPDGEKLQQVSLAGGGSVEIAGTAANPGISRIIGDSIDMGVAEGTGTTLRTLDVRAGNATERAEMQLPSEDNGPSRVVRASEIHGPVPGDMPPQKELSSLRFTDNVEYREVPATGQSAMDRVVYSRVLDLALAPGLGTLEEARFSGNVAFREGQTRQASSRDARYVLKTGEILMTGTDEKGQPPQIVDERATIQADRILTGTGDEQNVHAEGSVRAMFKGKTSKILSADKPVYATSDRLDYTGNPGHATFSSKGRAQVWQPDRTTAVYGATIQIDDKTGNLSADGSVLTRMLVDQTDDKTKQKRKVVAEATSDSMVYEDAPRTVTYSSSVHFRSPEGDLKTDKAIVFLAADGSTIDRIEAYGHVVLQASGLQETGMRNATGDTLVYTAANEQYALNGNVVKYSDECYETQAKSLTFYRSVGRIVVDGNEERRTQTKGGLGCRAASPKREVASGAK